MRKSEFVKAIFSSFFFLTILFPQALSASPAELEGKVLAEDNSIVDFATIHLEGTSVGTFTDSEGRFSINFEADGEYTLVVSAIGYKTVRIPVRDNNYIEIVLTPDTSLLDEAVVTASGITRVKRSAFNAVAVDTKDMLSSSKSLGDALMQLPGMKLRESGGVGSDMQLMLDGFSGKHVKVFIDGVPQEGSGTAFDLNNIPVNFAERIEVYKGVVPVGFGSDAIGGVINIVTNKTRRSWHLDASYSYGSFNTHKSYLNFGQTFDNGFTYEVNAFQNYSDNSYHINNWVREWEIREDGSIYKYPVDRSDIKRVRRFHDTFHNEVVMAKAGVVGKKWADRLMFGLSYSSFYKEIQTGVYQETVFGDKHRHGYSVVPSVEYVKKDLIVKNLDLTVTSNYNYNITRNIDTSSFYYNWYGDRYDKGTKGEQAYMNSLSHNSNWNTTANLTYRISKAHTFTLNSIYSDFIRKSRSYVSSNSVLTDYDIPKITRKSITGLSYRLMLSPKWNVSVFGKYYFQYNQGPVSQSADGVGNYISLEKFTDSFGYGAAGTWYILEDLQAKLSYEKAYRLPTTDELFGDEDLEAGKADLRPENSHNLNFNLSYNFRLAPGHSIYAEGSLIYRDTKDYIKRTIGNHGTTQFGIYENHGHVRTQGFNLSLRYTWAGWLSLGGTFNNIDTRDYERYVSGSSQQESLHYKVRLPNIPYMYANSDISFYWHDLFAKGNVLTLTYDNFWQHKFPLQWENIGSSDTKSYVPEQFSHNISLTYSIKNGKYSFSVECRNITDAMLYDNFSLQKAGRAIYAKVRVNLGKY